MKGIVKELKGNLAVVQIRRKEACGECRACLSGMTEKDMDIEAKNLCEAEVGDWVELELQENAFFNAVVIMYGVPLLGFIVGLLLGYYAVPQVVALPATLCGLVLGAAGLLLAYFWIKSQNARWESGKYRPLATRIAEEEDGSFCGI